MLPFEVEKPHWKRSFLHRLKLQEKKIVRCTTNQENAVVSLEGYALSVMRFVLCFRSSVRVYVVASAFSAAAPVVYEAI